MVNSMYLGPGHFHDQKSSVVGLDLVGGSQNPVPSHLGLGLPLTGGHLAMQVIYILNIICTEADLRALLSLPNRLWPGF